MLATKVADGSSNDLQTAMSALENAISMLGSVTTTRADPDDGKLEWTARVTREEPKTVSAAHWRFRPSKTGSGTAASTELSNTLSLLDSTIVAIDSAMSPPSSKSDRPQVRPTDNSFDFRRADVVTSGFRPTDRRFDSGVTSTSGGASYSWRSSQAWSSRTQQDLLPRTDHVELGTVYCRVHQYVVVDIDELHDEALATDDEC